MREHEIRRAASFFIARTINQLADAGWGVEAHNLASDLDRAGSFLPELLMVRDDAERLAAQLEANQ